MFRTRIRSVLKKRVSVPDASSTAWPFFGGARLATRQSNLGAFGAELQVMFPSFTLFSSGINLGSSVGSFSKCEMRVVEIISTLCNNFLRFEDVTHPPFAERRALAVCVFELTGGRGFAPNVRAANEWMRGTMTKG
jgi:hypothetical protein